MREERLGSDGAHLSHGAPHGALHGSGACGQPFHTHSSAHGVHGSLHFFLHPWWSHAMRQGLRQGGQGAGAWQGPVQSCPHARGRSHCFLHATCRCGRSSAEANQACIMAGSQVRAICDGDPRSGKVHQIHDPRPRT